MQRLLILLLLPVLLPLYGQEVPAEKKIYFTQAASSPLKIDGHLNDPAWDKVKWGGGDFIVNSPNEGEPASEKTTFKILYDARNLYVGIRAYDAEPEKIVRQLSRRDGFEGDWVEINIDSYFDHRTAFSFTITAAGVRGDEFISQNGENWDSNWDPVWRAKTALDSLGWTAEMAIPFSQLRFGEKDEQVWGIQFTRRYYRKNERSNWQFVPQNSSGWVHLFGELHGIEGIKAPRRVELLPYSLAKTRHFPEEPGNPFATGVDNDVALGLDGKIGLSSDLTLDLTVNPDFGQVEADPSEVNLTAFETFFEEKRPFFIEGRNIFDFQVTESAWGGSYSQDNLFYSRRIGRRPQYDPETGDNEYSQIPDNSSILGAMKITGKTKSGLSIGVMESVTAREEARIDLAGERRREAVEPLSNYFAGRLQQDFDQGNTVLGGMITAVNRDVSNENLYFLPRAAYSGGLDLVHNWKERKYYISANTIFSQVSGEREAIQALQTAPARYFQRPGADHLTLDSSRTSLSGYGGTLTLGRRGNFKYQSGVTWRSPGIELNDIGFLRKADEINHWTWVGFRVSKPVGIFHSLAFNANEQFVWDFSGQKLSTEVNTNSHLQFRNYWNVGMSITYEFDQVSNDALRGGPALKLPGGVSGEVYFNSDQRKKLRLNFGTWQYWGNENAVRTRNYWGWMGYRPFNAMSLSVNPYYTLRRNELQFVDRMRFGSEDRHLFGQIDQETMGITFRLSYSVTPVLSIEYYGAPFVSAGAYERFKRITDPQAGAYRERFDEFSDGAIAYDPENESYRIDEDGDGSADYQFDRPDFNYREFNSNLVIRWEYAAGSTLFLVWSQGREDSAPNGRFAFGNDLQDLFRSDARNIFLIKVSRWFSL